MVVHAGQRIPTDLHFIEDEQGRRIESFCVLPLYVKSTSSWMGRTLSYDDGRYYLRWPALIAKGETFSNIRRESSSGVFTNSSYHWIGLLILKPGYKPRLLGLDSAEPFPDMRWLELGSSDGLVQEFLSPTISPERLKQIFLTVNAPAFPIENDLTNEDREALRSCYFSGLSSDVPPDAELSASSPGKVKSPSDLASLFAVPAKQWPLTHFCVPAELNGSGLTYKDYSDGLMAIWKSRWAEGLAAQARGDFGKADLILAHLNHELVDAYIPGRVERDASGAITRLRGCGELGNLSGILESETKRSHHRFVDGPGGFERDNPIKERALGYARQISSLWNAGYSFDEAAEVLLSGPIKFSAEILARPVSP